MGKEEELQATVNELLNIVVEEGRNTPALLETTDKSTKQTTLHVAAGHASDPSTIEEIANLFPDAILKVNRKDQTHMVNICKRSKEVPFQIFETLPSKSANADNTIPGDVVVIFASSVQRLRCGVMLLCC